MLGGASVVGTTVASVVVSYVVVGAEAMQGATQIPFAIVYAIEGIILFSLAAGQYVTAGRKR
jgi:ABC-type uncharacterized transport system permease subunit